jgi:hypothetical protein
LSNKAVVSRPEREGRYLAWCDEHADGIWNWKREKCVAWVDAHNAEHHPEAEDTPWAVVSGKPGAYLARCAACDWSAADPREDKVRGRADGHNAALHIREIEAAAGITREWRAR